MQSPIHYQITLHCARLEIVVHYPKIKLDKIYFSAPNWNGKLYETYVSQVTAYDDTCELEVVSCEKQWCVHSNGQAFTLSYTFCFPRRIGETGRFYPLLKEDVVCLWGYLFLLKPLSKDILKLPCTVDVLSPEPFYTSWHIGELIPNFYELQDSMLVAGELKKCHFDISDIEISVLLYGNIKSAVAQQMFDIIKQQIEWLGFYPLKRLVVIVASELTSSHGRGLYVKGGIAIFPNSPEPHQVLHTFAHEHFHVWNGHYAFQKKLSEPESFYWFQEGFTDYFAEVSLLKTQWITPLEFVQWLNQLFLKVHSDQLSDQLSPRQNRQSEMVRGALMALYLDTKFQGVGMSLLDRLRTLLLQFPPESSGYSLMDLKKGLELDPFSWSQQQLYELLAPHKVMQTVNKEVFFLGFAVDTPWLRKQSRVKAVDVQSNAFQAGLRIGDVILNYKYVRYKPEVAVDLTIRDSEGLERDIHFFPSLEQMVSQFIWDEKTEGLFAHT